MVSQLRKKDGLNATGRANLLTGIASVFFIVLAVCLSVYSQRAPDTKPERAPSSDFSSGRAMNHLRAITKKPHPIGSAEHAEVRSYLLNELTALGLSPEVQTTTVLNRTGSAVIVGATVKNITAKMPGMSNSKAVMLVAHYDSALNSLGASDDGSGVVSILETLRALKETDPLKNDVICLFTDGEEEGLLGAKAFIEENPWIKDVGLVLNFEARGNSGPAIMFETSNQNGWLINEFAEAAPHPIANSLSYELYRLLPNDTDLTVFKKAGLPGLNFAYINEVTHYHSALDNIGSIDERSVQHHGSYALALTRHYGNLDLNNVKARNSIYFDLLGAVLVRYSDAWVVPILALVTLAFVAVVILGLKRKLLTLTGIIFGFFALLMTMIVAGVTVSLLWWIISSIHSGYTLIVQGDTYNSGYYFIGFVALTVALASVLYAWFLKKTSAYNLTFGALLWWLVLMICGSLLLPGSSYLFTWPLFFSLIGMAVLFASDGKEGAARNYAIMTASAIPGIILMVPLIYLISVAMGVWMYGAVMVLTVLLIGLMIPQLSLIISMNRLALPVTLAVACLALLLTGSLTSGFDKSHRKPNNLLYGLNADTGQAIWASADAKPDEWTAQYLSWEPQRGRLTEILPLSFRDYLKNSAPAVSLPAPGVSVLDRGTGSDAQTLRLRITSGGQSPVLSIYVDPEAEIAGASINGKQIESVNAPAPGGVGRWWALQYYGVSKDGIELVLTVKAGSELKMTVVEMAYGFPDAAALSLNARPDDMMPSIFSNCDTTLVSKSFSFPLHP